MKHYGNRVEDLKIAYIGGGSRGWAWTLMSDLARAGDIAGTVYLYDINYDAAKRNEKIGNSLNSAFTYKAAETLREALTGADFTIISVIPGTFDEMESDVHTPEKYGIWQSVGDTTGPGGYIRALRTLPMFEAFARAIKEYCPETWVINYTNPMTMCVRALYKAFPEIKAFGCCHEVFKTQETLGQLAAKKYGMESIPRHDVKMTVVGLNHFTWVTEAHWKSHDLMPLYREFCEDLMSKPVKPIVRDEKFSVFGCQDRVKADLFLRYNVAAAAGDRHLAEFCPGYWYLKNPETAESWGFVLTPVSWRRGDLKARLDRSEAYYSGKEKFTLKESGEEGVDQLRALLGLGDLTTNVNLPNMGQIANLPLGAVVETNAYFTSGKLVPVFSGNIPMNVMPLIAPVCARQELAVEACLRRDLSLAFHAFVTDPLVTVSQDDAKKLFDEMCGNTREYLKEYK
jgi:alpha-galactosidase